MTKPFERESLGDLFQNAEIRREAMSAATGETRLDKSAPKPLPAWRQRLAGLEARVGQWPWASIRQSVLLLALLGGGFWAWDNRSWLNDKVTTAIAEATGATVQKIEVTGLTHTAQADLLNSLGLGRGSSLVGFDASAAKARIEQLPWVRLASVERQLPATVKVQIYEHVPLARAISGSVVFVLNAQGAPVVADTANAFVGLPLLQGEGAPNHASELFARLQPYPNLLLQLREASWVGERRWDLRFVSGVTVMLPAGRVQEGIELLVRLEAARHVLTLNDGVVDLRLPDRIILRLPATVAVTPVTNLKPASHVSASSAN